MGADTLIGGGGADFVDGGQDDDLLELDGSAGVTAEGGDGTDTVLVGETNEASLSGAKLLRAVLAMTASRSARMTSRRYRAEKVLMMSR